jgi:gamma-glutamylcyclotransferase
MSTTDDGPEEHHYFAYGANMDGERVHRHCPGAHTRRPGRLPGHRLVFDKATNDFDGSASANIQSEKDAHVEGALYTLNEKDLLRIDQSEGHPRHYTRRLHAVEEADGTKTIAWVYHATPTYIRDGLAPRQAYLEHLLAQEDVLSAEYRKALERLRPFEAGR